MSDRSASLKWMASYLDSVPLSGIIRIRDMMYSVADPFRLDQGDVSFDAPDSVKSAMTRAIAENRSHYLQTTGVPRLRELIAAKLRSRNGIPIDDVEDVLVTHGGIHGLYMICMALLEPGDEVLLPDPEWPPAAGNILAARGVPVGYRLHEANGWRPDFDEIESKISPRTRVLYVNSPSNPTGGVLTRADLERLAGIARARPVGDFRRGVRGRGVRRRARQHRVAARDMRADDPALHLQQVVCDDRPAPGLCGDSRRGHPRAREENLCSTPRATSPRCAVRRHRRARGSQDCIEAFREELRARRDLFYRGVRESAGRSSGTPPARARSTRSCGSIRVGGPSTGSGQAAAWLGCRGGWSST